MDFFFFYQFLQQLAYQTDRYRYKKTKRQYVVTQKTRLLSSDIESADF